MIIIHSTNTQRAFAWSSFTPPTHRARIGVNIIHSTKTQSAHCSGHHSLHQHTARICMFIIHSTNTVCLCMVIFHTTSIGCIRMVSVRSANTLRAFEYTHPTTVCLLERFLLNRVIRMVLIDTSSGRLNDVQFSTLPGLHNGCSLDIYEKPIGKKNKSVEMLIEEEMKRKFENRVL